MTLHDYVHTVLVTQFAQLLQINFIWCEKQLESPETG